MFAFILKGGPVMFPIILGSILGLAIVIERFWTYSQVMKLDSYAFAQQIYRLIKEGRFQAAIEQCNTYARYPLAVIFKIGIERRALPLDRLEKIIEQAGNNQIAKLEKMFGWLVAIISIEPMLGFLGTITGLIKAFRSWEVAGADITVSILAAGIYEAMITTAAGLTAAIPLYLAYTYFVSQIKLLANDLTNHGIQLLEVIGEVPATSRSDARVA